MVELPKTLPPLFNKKKKFFDNHKNFDPAFVDYSEKKALIGLSGGINSAAVLVWLSRMPKEFMPSELHLFYSHLREHSPGTLRFVSMLVKYARKKFPFVKFELQRYSALDYFEKIKLIPHPILSPCTRDLKTKPTAKYIIENNITEDVVGYVKEEFKRRAYGMADKLKSDIDNIVWNGANVRFPIADKANEWCFDIVKESIGWYPPIYDLRNEKGKRIFLHNNCLPCKNMTVKQLKDVEKYYPRYLRRALKLTKKLNYHMGRNSDEFYTTFGRDNLGNEDSQPCVVCSFD